MDDPALLPGTPRKVLLATDLGARGDRALERVLFVAARDDAQLIIVHALEDADAQAQAAGTSTAPAGMPADLPARVKQRIRQGMRADASDILERAKVLVEPGEPADVIERIATTEHVDVIVTGIARERPFSTGPVVLGKTVEKLLRRLPAPILIVRNRALAPYQRVVVATDFSEPSAHALQMALRFFPGQTLHLLHATDPARAEDGQQASREQELEQFLSSVFMPESDRARLVPLFQAGAPQQIVRDHVQHAGADLLVLGTRGRGVMLEALLGSTAKSILSALPCDALVVRAPAQ